MEFRRLRVEMLSLRRMTIFEVRSQMLNYESFLIEERYDGYMDHYTQNMHAEARRPKSQEQSLTYGSYETPCSGLLIKKTSGYCELGPSSNVGSVPLTTKSKKLRP